MKLKISEKELEWLASENTGISSRTIFHVITRLPKELILQSSFGPGIPHDLSDFYRCYLLLKKFPEWKNNLYLVSLRYPQWKYFIKYWDLLCHLTEKELTERVEVSEQKFSLFYHVIKLFGIMGKKELKNQEKFELLLHYTNLKFLECFSDNHHCIWFKALIHLTPDSTILNIELKRGDMIQYNSKNGVIKKGLWEENDECPNCGQKSDQEIRSCETGSCYCSNECTKEHVNEKAPEGGY